MNDITLNPLLQREVLVFALYEAAELEHNLMCTYLYAAFSLKSDAADGLNEAELAAGFERERAEARTREADELRERSTVAFSATH